MGSSSWFARLEQTQTSYLLLATLAGTVLAVGVLYRLGVLGWVLRVLGLFVRAGIGKGFLLWERSFGWASWQEFLVIVFGILFLGGWPGGLLPGLRFFAVWRHLAWGPSPAWPTCSSTWSETKWNGATRSSTTR